MRPLTTFATLAVLAASALVALAQDPKTYALDTVERSEVGDVYTETVEESATQKMKIAMGANVMQDTSEATKVRYVKVTKVLAVSDKGKETKVQVYFKKFTRSEGGFDDDTLKGKVFEITTAADGTGTWRHHAGEGNITSSAKEWLNGQMSEANQGNAAHAAAEKALKPSKPVAVGESWKPGMAELAKMLEMGDGSKATGSCKLEKIETRAGVELAHVSMTAELPLTEFPGMEGMPVKWSKGGTMKFSHTGTMPTSARIAPGESKSSFALEGEANMQGATVEMTIKGSENSVVTLDGVIPDLPLIPVKVTPEPAAGDGEKK